MARPCPLVTGPTLTESSSTAWLIRAGEGGFALTDFVIAGVVALGYAPVDDASELELDDITEQLTDAGESKNPGKAAEVLHRFVNDVEVGDLIVTPHAGSQSVYFGSVISTYTFVDPSPVDGFRHQREVRWFGHVDREDIPEDLLADVDRPPAFFELKEQLFWWDVSEDAEDAEEDPADVLPPPRAERQAPGKSSGGATVKTMLCDVCGIMQPAATVEDGVCASCS